MATESETSSRGDHRRRLRRIECGARVEAHSGRDRVDRSRESSPVSAAAVSSRHVRLAPDRDRHAHSESLAQAAECHRVDGRSDRRGYRSAACCHVTGFDQPVAYDYLVLATGAQGSYFGHDEWEPYAPGLKTARDALVIRNKILKAFELAEVETDPERRKELLTFRDRRRRTDGRGDGRCTVGAGARRAGR